MADDTLALLRQVESIAALGALRGWMDEKAQVFVMDFETGSYRSQRVFVRVTTIGPGGKPMITIQSPARVIGKGWLRRLSRTEALGLLADNESLRFARYGLVNTPGGMMVMLSSDLMLDTLDAEELRIHAYAVANTADRYEAQFGGDQF